MAAVADLHQPALTLSSMHASREVQRCKMQRLSVLERHLTSGSDTGGSPWAKVPQVGHPSPPQHAE
jgi:hypothetical protein